MALDSSQILTGEKLAPVLEAGAKIVQEAIQRQVSTKAKRATGQLEASISYEIHADTGRAPMGWQQNPIRGKGGTRKRSSFVDRRGRSRKVSTVADYGRILEYSERRQLRHMEQGFIDAEEAATSKMEAMCDALLDQAVEAQMSKAGL